MQFMDMFIYFVFSNFRGIMGNQFTADQTVEGLNVEQLNMNQKEQLYRKIDDANRHQYSKMKEVLDNTDCYLCLDIKIVYKERQTVRLIFLLSFFVGARYSQYLIKFL